MASLFTLFTRVTLENNGGTKKSSSYPLVRLSIPVLSFFLRHLPASIVECANPGQAHHQQPNMTVSSQ